MTNIDKQYKTTLSIFRSMKTNYLTQDFNESKACCKVDQYGRPLLINGNYLIKGKESSASCPIGYTNFYHAIGMKNHNGKDFSTWHGEPLYHKARAKNKNGEWVKWYAKSEVDTAGGIGVDVFSADRIYFPTCPKELGSLKMIEREWNENEGWLFVKFRYWHLKETHIKNTFKPEGDYQWVKCGDFIGKADNSGASSGDHSHEGEKVTNDQSWTIDNDNGYYGAISYDYDNRFVLDVLKEENEAKKKELEAQVVELQLTFIDLLRKYISELQIQVLKLSRKVGSIINK